MYEWDVLPVTIPLGRGAPQSSQGCQWNNILSCLSDASTLSCDAWPKATKQSGQPIQLFSAIPDKHPDERLRSPACLHLCCLLSGLAAPPEQLHLFNHPPCTHLSLWFSFPIGSHIPFSFQESLEFLSLFFISFHFIFDLLIFKQGGLTQWLSGKESTCNAGATGETGLIPEPGRSPGEGSGNPFQYSCLENSHGQRRWAGYNPWGRKDSDMTKATEHAPVEIELYKWIWEMEQQAQRPWGGFMLTLFIYLFLTLWGLIGGSDGKESTCKAGDLGSIPGLGRSPGEGHGNPLQYFFLENPHGQRSLAGCSPWGCKELDMTEKLSTAHVWLSASSYFPVWAWMVCSFACISSVVTRYIGCCMCVYSDRHLVLHVFCDLKMSLKKRKLKQAHKCENLPTVS